MKVFVDTGAWLGLKVVNDEHHLEAKSYFGKAKKSRAMLFTNEYVLVETYTRLIYDFGLSAAQKFNEWIRSGVGANLTVIEIDERERNRVWEILEKYRDHNLSFTDATIAVNFFDYNLDEIFTFDRHFRDINLPTNLS